MTQIFHEVIDILTKKRVNWEKLCIEFSRLYPQDFVELAQKCISMRDSYVSDSTFANLVESHGEDFAVQRMMDETGMRDETCRREIRLSLQRAKEESDARERNEIRQLHKKIEILREIGLEDVARDKGLLDQYGDA